MRRADWPARYEIRVDTVLDERWVEWFEWLHMVVEDDETVLTGIIPDQSALRGILKQLGDLGISVTLVRRISEE